MKKFLLILFSLLIFILLFPRPLLFINEFYYDSPSADTHSFLEIKGIPGTLMDSVKVILVNGNGGAIYGTIDLSGKTIPSDSYFVIAQDSGVENLDTITTTINMQNGPSDNILIVYDSIGVSSRVTLDAVCYGLPSAADTVFRGEVWPTYDVTPSTGYYAIMARYEDPFVSDYNNNYLDFAHYIVRNPGLPNKPLILKSIVDIQNSVDSFSLYKDSTVKIIDTCVVTAAFSGQYYVTSKTGPKEWDGINVYGDISSSSPYNVGDTIIFYHGFVKEYYNKTEIVSAGTELYKAGDGTSPKPYTVSLNQIGESFEGVLIKVGPVVVISALDTTNKEWLVSDGVDTLKVSTSLASYTIPSIGSTVNITGILDFITGFYKLQPRNDSDIEILSTVSGTVSLDDTTDYSGVTVKIFNETYSDSIITDSTGNYSFSLASGTYNLTFEKTYYQKDSLNFVLSSDTTINSTLSRLKTNITGKVSLSDSPSDLSNSIVSLISSIVIVDTTDNTGNYSFNNISYGYTYKLKFEHDGYQPDSVTFLLSGPYSYDVTLTKLAGIDENLLPEKIIVENNEGMVSFIYNKEVDSPTSIEIYDLTGRNILYKEITSSRGVYKITLTETLSKGVYFIQVNGDLKPVIKKFVIIK